MATNESSMPAALVTGATGFIGGRLAMRLVSAGWRVKLLVRDAAKLPGDLQGAEVTQGDLANETALAEAVSDVSVIFHCAANVHTWDSKDAYWAANVVGVQNLLNAIAQHNPKLTRLVHLSTVDVYGFPEQPCDENHATPASGFGYGDSKREGETLVREFCMANRIPCTVIRPANVIGPQSQFIERIGKELQSGIMLTIDKGKANAGLVYIDNLIDYLIWAGQVKDRAFHCYNMRDNYDVDWATFIQKFRKAIKGRGLVVNLPFGVAGKVAKLCEAFYSIFLPAHEPLLHRLVVRIFGRTCGHSAEKIRAASGLASRVGFEEAMQRSIEWFLARKP